MKFFPTISWTGEGLAGQFMRRLILPLLLIALSFFGGTLGFYILGGSKWSLLDCLYMTSITLTTVGYGEVLEGMGQGARILAMVLMWVGMAVVLYAVSTATAFVVEKNLSRYIRERRMIKRIEELNGHIIVCGLDATGRQVVQELYASGQTPVGLELNQENIDRASSMFPDMPIIKGDASSEEFLRKAGVERAAAVLALLPEDGQNLLITVETNYIDPNIKIAARTSENSLSEKFRRAGADYVVNPSFIGGMRLASVIARPNVVGFLDKMLRGDGPSVRVEEATVREGSVLIGKSLGEAAIFETTGLRPVALKPSGTEEYIYNPTDDEIIGQNMVIIVIGDHERLEKLRKICKK